MRKAIRGLVRRDKSQAKEETVSRQSPGPLLRTEERDHHGTGHSDARAAILETEQPATQRSVAPADDGHHAALDVTSENSNLTPDTPADTVAENLWSCAYDALSKREPELVKDYERHIGTLRDEAAPAATFRSPQSVKDAIEALQDERKSQQWKFSVRSKDHKVRDQLEKLVKLLSFADGIVKQAVSAQPYAALAWSAVSVFLPVG